MIFDSTPDISHKDQTSQILRYVMIDGNDVCVMESFIDFIETKGKSAEEISRMIFKKSEDDGIDIQNCRGQAYDNAAVMAGKHTGVQSRIKQINPRAEFVACTNHSLNLACVHAASVSVSSVTFFGTVERLFTFFSSSTHRWDVLTTLTGHGVMRIAETRWSARGEAVTTVKNNFPGILNVLEKLTGEEENAVTRSDIGLLLSALQCFSFLCFLNLWESVLIQINDTQIYLQTAGLNIHQCDAKMKSLENYLIENREVLVCSSALYAKEICEDLGILMERRRRKKKLMFDENAEDQGLSYECELKREMFATLDRIVKEISLRFQQIHTLAEKYEFLTPTNLLDKSYSCHSCEIHKLHDVDAEQFLIERKILQNFISVPTVHARTEIWKKTAGPLELLKFIQRYRLENSIPNIVIVLRIFLTIAISDASCERSFSKLKLIKNHLRSRMSDLRLRNLAILSIEHELTSDINFDSIINDFASKKARKVPL